MTSTESASTRVALADVARRARARGADPVDGAADREDESVLAEGARPERSFKNKRITQDSPSHGVGVWCRDRQERISTCAWDADPASSMVGAGDWYGCLRSPDRVLDFLLQKAGAALPDPVGS